MRVEVLFERRRLRQLATCPLQANSRTPTDNRIVLGDKKIQYELFLKWIKNDVMEN